MTAKLFYPLIWFLDFASRKLGNRLIWGAPSEAALLAIMARFDQRILRYLFNRALYTAISLDKRFGVGYYEYPA